MSSPAIIKDSPFRAPSVRRGGGGVEKRREEGENPEKKERGGGSERREKGTRKNESGAATKGSPPTFGEGAAGTPFLPSSFQDSCGKGERGAAGPKGTGWKGTEPQHRASFGPDRRGCRSAPRLRPTPAVIISSSSKRCHPAPLHPPPPLPRTREKQLGRGAKPHRVPEGAVGDAPSDGAKDRSAPGAQGWGGGERGGGETWGVPGWGQRRGGLDLHGGSRIQRMTPKNGLEGNRAVMNAR